MRCREREIIFDDILFIATVENGKKVKKKLIFLGSKGLSLHVCFQRDTNGKAITSAGRGGGDLDD